MLWRIRTCFSISWFSQFLFWSKLHRNDWIFPLCPNLAIKVNFVFRSAVLKLFWRRNPFGKINKKLASSVFVINDHITTFASNGRYEISCLQVWYKRTLNPWIHFIFCILFFGKIRLKRRIALRYLTNFSNISFWNISGSLTNSLSHEKLSISLLPIQIF